MNKDFAFIISAGRTGTTFLGAKAAEVIHDCFSVHEPDNLSVQPLKNIERIREFGPWHMIFGRILGRTGPRALGTRYLLGSWPESHCRMKIERMRSGYYARQEASLIIESNPQWHYAIDLIPGVWPKAKIAIIIRDPRTWIQSWIQKGLRHTRMDLARYFPPGRIVPKHFNEPSGTDRLHDLDTFGKLAWEWQFVNRRLINHFEGNMLCSLFRYEDLFGESANEEMQRMVEFLAHHRDRKYCYDIPKNFTRDRYHESKGLFPGWQSWHPDRAMLVESLCSDLMRELGYGHEPCWREKLKTNRC